MSDTRSALTPDMDFAAINDGEGLGQGPDGGVFKIVMTRAQAAKLAEILDVNVDLETVALDNDDPRGAELVRAFVIGVREALAP